MKGLSVISFSDEQIEFLIDLLEDHARNDEEENALMDTILGKLHSVTPSARPPQEETNDEGE